MNEAAQTEIRPKSTPAAIRTMNLPRPVDRATTYPPAVTARKETTLATALLVAENFPRTVLGMDSCAQGRSAVLATALKMEKNEKITKTYRSAAWDPRLDKTQGVKRKKAVATFLVAQKARKVRLYPKRATVGATNKAMRLGKEDKDSRKPNWVLLKPTSLKKRTNVEPKARLAKTLFAALMAILHGKRRIFSASVGSLFIPGLCSSRTLRSL